MSTSVGSKGLRALEKGITHSKPTIYNGRCSVWSPLDIPFKKSIRHSCAQLVTSCSCLCQEPVEPRGAFSPDPAAVRAGGRGGGVRMLQAPPEVGPAAGVRESRLGAVYQGPLFLSVVCFPSAVLPGNIVPSLFMSSLSEISTLPARYIHSVPPYQEGEVCQV